MKRVNKGRIKKEFDFCEFHTVPFQQLLSSKFLCKYVDYEYVKKMDWKSDLVEYGLTPILVYPFNLINYQKPFFTFIDKDQNILPIKMDELSWFIGPIAVGLKDGDIYIFNQAKNTVTIHRDVKCSSVLITHSMTYNYEYIKITYTPKEPWACNDLYQRFNFDFDGNELDFKTLDKKILESLSKIKTPPSHTFVQQTNNNQRSQNSNKTNESIAANNEFTKKNDVNNRHSTPAKIIDI